MDSYITSNGVFSLLSIKIFQSYFYRRGCRVRAHERLTLYGYQKVLAHNRCACYVRRRDPKKKYYNTKLEDFVSDLKRRKNN